MEQHSWGTEAVLKASHDWLWVPPGVKVVDTGWMRAVVSDKSHTLGVAWVNSDHDPESTYTAVMDIAGEHQCDVVKWTTSSATRPIELERLLIGQDARLQDTTKILALELSQTTSSAIEVPPTVNWSVVDSPAKWDQADEVARSAWGGDSPTPEERRSAHAELKLSIREREGFQVLSTIDGVPAATGGVTVAGQVARLWGACTHPQFRRRGAYRATVRGRLATAQRNGCTLALSNALSDTSAPTLESLGFVDYGLKKTWVISV